MPPQKHIQTDTNPDSKPKKRHRHSSSQLAALNELYEQDEHPALHLRTTLAASIGMETKTVNAWFQNKRASSRKRSKAGTPYDPPYTSAAKGSSSHSAQSLATQDQSDEEQYMSEAQASRPPMFVNSHTRQLSHPSNQYIESSSFATGSPEEDTAFSRMRLRLSIEQVDELRAHFNLNQHPSKDEREALGERLGMRYQTVTNWFQNQRSMAARKRKDDDLDNQSGFYSIGSANPLLEDDHLPSATHPSLVQFAMNVSTTRRTRSSSTTPSTASSPSRRSTSQRGSTPYGHALLSTMSQRTRRTRPEAYQLDALKELFNKTQHPSIQERTALAQDLGMDVVKVTNWFRNLRQTSRKRAKKGSHSDDDDNDNESFSSYHHDKRFRSLSRSTSSFDGDNERLDMNGNIMHHSDMDSDDDYYQEAVTPSPERSPSPRSPSPRTQYRRIDTIAIEPYPMSQADKAAAAKYSDIKYEDAMLLLSFHQHIVH